MTDFNLRHNKQGAWEWEHVGTTFGTDPNGNGVWRKLPKPEPKTIPLPRGKITYTEEWEQIVDRALFHLPADRTGAINHLTMYYGV